MVYTDSFDDFLSTERQLDEIDLPPFQFREKKDEDGTHEWLVQNFDNCERASHSRRITYRRYQALYKNIHWRFFDTRDTRRDMEYTQRRPRHSVNFIWEMVEARVAQMSRLGINITALPNNDEQDDINNSKSCKMLLDARAEDIDLRGLHEKADRVEFTFGHSFFRVDWSPDCGPLHPSYRKLKEKYPEGLPKEVKKKLKKETIHIGDVEVKLYGPDKVYVELNKFSWEDMDHIEFIDFIKVEELKEMYPGKASEITENTRQIYDFDSAELIRPKNLIMVRTFYHRPTKWFPEGAKIVYNDDVILEWTDFPYTDGKLPAVPCTDIDVYGEFWGRSFISNIEQLQRFYNNLQSSVARDYSLASAAKWVMPKGSCNVHSLNNDITIVEYTGPQAPQLVRNTPTSNQLLDIQDRLEKKMSQHAKVYDISRGEVPSGVTANSALRFLDEQESQTLRVSEEKRKKRVIEVYRLMLSRMQQYYKASDDRTVRILGKNNEFMIKSMKKADFTRIYDIKLQNTSALPDTKVGKISAIIDLNTATQTDPIFRKEEIIEMLDLGNDEYFKSKSTVSVNSARTALEELLEGGEVEPKPWDDLLVHYSVFDKAVQEYQFKSSVSEEIQASVAAYILTLEMLMFERAKKNMKFCTQLMEMDNFPMMYTLDLPLAKVMAAHQMDLQGIGQMPTPQGGQQPVQTQEIEKIPLQTIDEGADS